VRRALALGAVDLGLALAAAALFALAATGRLAPVAYQVGVVGFLIAGTVLWVRVERAKGRGRGVLRRLAAAVGGLALAVLAGPVLVLTPLFAIAAEIPQEAGFTLVVAVAMESLRLGLVVAGTMTLLGGLASLAVGLARRG
jgi:hypothetical protein